MKQKTAASKKHTFVCGKDGEKELTCLLESSYLTREEKERGGTDFVQPREKKERQKEKERGLESIWKRK